MPSLASRLTLALLRLIRLRETLHRQWITPPPRKPGEGRPPGSVTRRYALTQTALHDRTVYAVSPRNGATSPLTVVYLHGGGFIINANPPNWSLTTQLVAALGCTVIAPDYPLAPEQPYPAALDFTRALYHELVTTRGLSPENLVLLGDSAGAALALRLCQELTAAGHPQPRHLALLWPWLDLTMNDPLVAAIEPTDVLLSSAAVAAAARYYAGPTADLTAPHLSPLFGDVAGLPPMSIFIGTRDLLLADSRRLRDKATAAGQPLHYHEYEGMPHGWMLLPFLPETKAALAQLVTYLKRVPVQQPAGC